MEQNKDMTKLEKTINREVEINGEYVIASMEPCGEFRIRRKRCRNFDSIPMASIIDRPIEKKCQALFDAATPEKNSDSLILNRLKARVAVTPMDTKIKFQVLAAIDDLLEVEEILKF